MAPRRAELTAAPNASRIRDVVCRVLVLPVGERAAAARPLCRGDRATWREVRRLLRHAELKSSFLRPPDTVLPHDTADEIGRIVGGRWRLERLLGEGAGGTVYETTDVETGRRAAVKMVYGLSAPAVRSVRREIALLRWLRLPGVVHLIDDGAEHGAVFCVTEIVDGTPFPGVEPGRSWDVLAPAALGLLDAVASVHAAGVVHCDLKPGNVLVDARGAITIVDLGISSEAHSPFAAPRGNYAAGTRHYAAPEQLRGAPPDVRSDLYSVGVMLFEALTGRYPGPDPAPECAVLPAPPRVCGTIARLLAPRRAARPRAATDVLRSIRPAPPRRLRRTRWTETGLRERFAGPDLLLHLREDGAREVFRRTGGRPRDVENEIASWIRTGLAREEAGLVVIERPALERLRMLAAPSRGLSLTSEDRLDRTFERALRRGEPRSVARTALRVAARRLAQGRPSSAMAVLFEGAAAACAAGDQRLEMRVLREAASAAVRTAVSSELDRALLVIQRSSIVRADVRDVETSVRAALHFHAGRPRDAMNELVTVCGRCDDDDVLRIAWSVRNTVARAIGLEEERNCLAEMRQWLASHRIRGAAGILANAEGWLRYHESRFARAMRLHLRAAAAAQDPHGQARCLLDAASAAIECQPTEARRLAARARRIGASLRNAVHEGRALHVSRLALVRSGAAAPPNRELVDAAGHLGLPALAGGAAFNEAVLAWRTGDGRSARELAMTAARAWRGSPRGDLARSLAAAVGEPFDDATLGQCLDSASRRLPAAVGMQVFGLLAVARPSWRPRLRRTFARLRLPPGDRDEARIREAMSVEAARKLVFA